MCLCLYACVCVFPHQEKCLNHVGRTLQVKQKIFLKLQKKKRYSLEGGDNFLGFELFGFFKAFTLLVLFPRIF